MPADGGELSFKAADGEVQLNAAVELGFLARTGAEAGHLTREPFVLRQGDAATLGSGGIQGGRKAAGGGSVGIKPLHPTLIERVEMLSRLAGDIERSEEGGRPGQYPQRRLHAPRSETENPQRRPCQHEHWAE